MSVDCAIDAVDIPIDSTMLRQRHACAFFLLHGWLFRGTLGRMNAFHGADPRIRGENSSMSMNRATSAVGHTHDVMIPIAFGTGVGGDVKSGSKIGLL